MAKFKFVNGVMVKDGNVPAKGTNVVPIATVCTPEEIGDASQVQTAMVVPQATQDAINEVTEDEFLSKFKCREGIDEDEILDRLSFLFAQYEVPIGLLNKLLTLTDYDINVILDDSGSMAAETDSTVGQAGAFMKATVLVGKPDSKKMTRWQEQEDRLHIMIDFIGCIPTGVFKVSFMNRSDKFTVEHKELTPDEWINNAHKRLRDACKAGPSGGTPTLDRLQEAFNNAKVKTMHYLFTDGVPSSNGGVEAVAKLIIGRSNPRDNPLTLISCTDVDDECKWMKQIEEDGPFVTEIDDYFDERDEVQHDQGPAFPFSRGLWLICMFVGAINPYDLDSLDDSRPMSKYTLDNIIGRGTTTEEYRKYWNNHPKCAQYESNYGRLSTEQKHTQQILGAHSTGAMGRLTNKFKAFGF